MKGAVFQPVKKVAVGPLEIGLPGKPVLIAGPCVLESRDLALDIAGESLELAQRHGFSYIFKASYDKANRTSISSFRGPGIEKGIAILNEVKKKYGVNILTDVHETYQVQAAAEVADILQIPAFLCRQTDLVTAAAGTGKAINLKKGQFLSPDEMEAAAEKARSTGNEKILITERGTFFGYGRLVVDMVGMAGMRAMGYPTIFDATHSVQEPGALRDRSGGDRRNAVVLARAAVAAGCDGLFIEVHPEPEKAKSDAATMLNFDLLEQVLRETAAILGALGRIAYESG